MAGKSNRSKSKMKGSKAMDSSSPPKDNTGVSEPSDIVPDGTIGSNAHEQPPLSNGKLDEKLESASAPSQASKQAEGDLLLYPVSVKSQTGEKLELQLSPGDSVMDVRQFLLDAPETCYFTCYDLILHTKDETDHSLEDYNEISEVADITTGGCSIEMVAALYDDRSIRSHIRRARDLLSASPQHSSLSTFLASQHETVQKTNAEKVEVPELESLGFMDDVSGSVGSLISTPSHDIACIKSIVFSSFNPPPRYRRLVGDLIYIDVETLEGSKFCITGSTRSFYVNSSSGNVLDPRPSKQHQEAKTLIGLLQNISSKFKKGFREILDRKSSAHPFENVQSLLSPNSWLGRYPIPDHKRDAARAEDALALTFGTELIGMQRDWNEELQSCREFPHKTLQERILRDRALYKVSCDFVDAAINGAVGVINRCIPPINPTDPECFHMYVHNNIFFSFAVDADLGQISKAHTPSTKGILSLDVSSTPILQEEAADVIHGTVESDTCLSESNGELRDYIHSSLDLSSEAQMGDGEQATYASANNDLKGTRAYQEADVPGLYNLAMAIIDYKGHRVVAQSIIPGILQGDKSDSLLYGSVDNGKKIAWNETFHSKVLEAAKRLNIKEHMVLDGSGNAVKLAAPVECKGIVGSDDRHYILDLMRVTPRDVNFSGPGSRFCILRPELVASFCQSEVAQSSKSHASAGEKAPEKSASENVNSPDIKDVLVEEKPVELVDHSSVTEKTLEEVLLNPNVFTEFKMAGTAEEIAADEASVKNASLYLVDVILSKFVQDLCSLEVSPMDGNTLTDALHAHGINIRYLGRVATMTKHLPHLWGMCTSEIIVRSAKHILKEILRETEDHDLASAIAHFLNCLFGNVARSGMKGSSDNTQLRTQKKGQANHQASRKSAKRVNPGAPARLSQPAFMLLTSESVWCQILDFARLKYQIELPGDAMLLVKKVSVIRNLCLKVGISVVARKYDLGSALPFQPSDIMNLQPVVKHSVPVSSEARDLIETGKARLAEGLLNEAYMIFSEAFSLLQQVTGPMHREVANCCRYLAMVLYHAGDMAGAITQQHKELIINERCLGLDHPDTAHSYGNMALFYHGLNQTELALQHMSRTLLLLGLSSGPDHPDVAATFINVAMMYQDIGKMETAIRYLQEALKKNERLLGADHIQTAVCHHALAITWNCMGNYRISLQQEKKTYDIFVKQLGKEDSRTRESDNWIKIFEKREKQAKQQQFEAANKESPEDAINFLKANPGLLKVFQDVAAKAGNLGSSSLGSGKAPLRGRGVDERAARAAAEVRKKAAAKGLSLRHDVFPVHATSHAQIARPLNTVNASAALAAAAVTECNEGKKEKLHTPIASEICSGGKADSENKPSANEKDQAPVGLGSGLSSLESKRQKQKS